jgi:hypothetical protein
VSKNRKLYDKHLLSKKHKNTKADKYDCQSCYPEDITFEHIIKGCFGINSYLQNEKKILIYYHDYISKELEKEIKNKGENIKTLTEKKKSLIEIMNSIDDGSLGMKVMQSMIEFKESANK